MANQDERRRETPATEEERPLFNNPEGVEPAVESAGDILAMMARGFAETPEVGHPLSPTQDKEADLERREETRRKPIVSIHGRDVPDEPEAEKNAA